MTERELFEKTIIEKCGFNPKTSFELSSATGDYKSDVIYFAWLMWQASANRQGYKLVPVEPTDEQIEKGRDYECDPFLDSRGIYKAMVGH